MRFQRIWSDFNAFAGSNKMKTVEIQRYFNIFHTWFFNLFLFQHYLFIRVSKFLFQHIFILTYFNKFSSTYFDVFQRVISTLFQPLEGLKYVEIRNLFQRYFNVILTPGFTDVLVMPGTNMYQTHFNFSSGSIRLATLTSLRSTLFLVNVLSRVA